jgi:AcrR family transcriptional regulator
MSTRSGGAVIYFDTCWKRLYNCDYRVICATHDYRTASLSRIVEKAGIAKGSMYQYFNNKSDLYLYLIDVATQKKLDYLNKNMDTSAEDFFSLYREMVFVSTKFNLSQPKCSRILYHAARESYNVDIGNLSARIREVAREHVQALMAPYRDKGQISDRVSLDLAAFCITQLSIDIEDYLSSLFGFSYAEVLKEGGESLPVPADELEKIIDQLIDFFKHGIQD